MAEETSNLSAMLYGLEEFRMEERPIPEPSPGDVQVAVASVGICGTDVGFWERGRIGKLIVKEPLALGHESSGIVTKMGEGVTTLKVDVQVAVASVGICGTDIGVWKRGRFGNKFVKEPMALGHESSGIVTKLGEGVTNLKVGDRVAVEPLRPCRLCEFCRSGRPYLCEHFCCLSIPPTSGNLCRYNVHPADFCFKLPDHVSLDEGALMEPLAVAVWACKRGNVSVGDKVLITGAGPIGLASLLAARAMGAGEICVANTSKPRLEIAKKMGADHVIHIDTDDAQDLADKIVQMIGAMPDSTIECSGAELAIRIGLYATKSGKTLVLCGGPTGDTKAPLVECVLREVNIIGSLCYPNCYPIALNLIASGAVNMKQMVTHHFPLEKAQEAFEVVKHRKDNVLKAIIHCSKTK